MKRLELNTDDETLRDVLSNGKHYYIPKFQRDYSWEQENWEQLWDDIQNLASGETEYHYMGYLVIQPPQKKSNEQKSKIVDGQQRLTTFSLLILSAIKRLKEMEDDEQERMDEVFKSFIGSKDLTYLRTENKLVLNRNNDYYYKKAVEGEALPKRGRKRTVHLMQKALDYFYHCFKQYAHGKEVGNLIETISERLLFTTIYIGETLDAYKVFETLNARGVQLSSADLLKNYLFSVIDTNNDTPDEVLDNLDKQWATIGSNIGDTHHTNYILSEWNSRNKLVRKTELFKNIRHSISDIKSAKVYLNTLENKSDIYAALLNPENEFWKDHPDYLEIKGNLSFLKLFNIRQPVSLLLTVYDQMPKLFGTVLEWIKVFSLRYNVICREHTGEQETLYNKIALHINRNPEAEHVKNYLLELYPNDDKFKQAFCDKTMLTEQSNKKARYLLARLEEHKSGQPIDETKLTVEHILPLNPEQEWIAYFGENWNLFKDRMGNFALVSNDENRKLGHKLFEEKKMILTGTNHSINQNIDDYQEWNSENIESRQKELADISVQLWRID